MGMFNNIFKPIHEFDIGNGEEADSFDGTDEESTTPTTTSPGQPSTDTPDAGQEAGGDDGGGEAVDFTGDSDNVDDDTATEDDAGNEDDSEVDYTLDDDTTEESQDGEEQPGGGEAPDGGDEDSDVDFTDDGAEEDMGDSSNIDGMSDDIPDDTPSENDPYSGLKDIERELFDNLTDAQKAIKVKELKQNFADLHERCDGIIEILNNTTPSDESTVRVFDYIQKTLIDLQNTTRDYLSHTFNTRSYLENDAQFKTYLVILNTIQNILGEINVQN